ncbi:hypothetical protein ACFQU2_37540 [Siccirubricoccus deserti]
MSAALGCTLDAPLIYDHPTPALLAAALALQVAPGFPEPEPVAAPAPAPAAVPPRGDIAAVRECMAAVLGITPRRSRSILRSRRRGWTAWEGCASSTC